jgi:hypothetical protein
MKLTPNIARGPRRRAMFAAAEFGKAEDVRGVADVAAS